MSSGEVQAARPPLRVARVRRGRMLGGVCAGLPRVWGLGTWALRVIFVLAGLCAGIGVILYLACWLVLPVGDEDPDRVKTPGVVWLAAGVGGLAALALVAAFSAAAAVFGLGWVVLGLAAVILVAGLGPLARRVPLTATLLGITALALPSIAVALTPLRVSLQGASESDAPQNVAAITHRTFTSGLGTQMIDLRRTRLPDSGSITMDIRAGLRRTIVALPADRCVRVAIHYDIHPFASHLATLMSGSSQPPFQGVVLFGHLFAVPGAQQRGTLAAAASTTTHAAAGDVGAAASDSGPTLDINFSSQGGSLYVRDYPEEISPALSPDWPGFSGTPEPPPDATALRREGDSARLVAELRAKWALRQRADIANERQVEALMPGPCAS